MLRRLPLPRLLSILNSSLSLLVVLLPSKPLHLSTWFLSLLLTRLKYPWLSQPIDQTTSQITVTPYMITYFTLFLLFFYLIARRPFLEHTHSQAHILCRALL